MASFILLVSVLHLLGNAKKTGGCPCLYPQHLSSVFCILGDCLEHKSILAFNMRDIVYSLVSSFMGHNCPGVRPFSLIEIFLFICCSTVK